VVTINSSVWLEPLLLHKLVIVLGEACFGIEGLSHQLSSMKELSVTVNKLSSSQPDVVLIEQFLYYLGRESCVPGSWKNPNPAHIGALIERITVLIEPSNVG